uniref:Uncharacterized protein n=1 Tax=uncultured marine virus TaxID=186617 RepID=A0A0F7L442_9VIRU|nr:hypothetical protein [uncultured marine virus]
METMGDAIQIFLATVLLGGLGFFIKRLINRVDSLTLDLSKHELHVSNHHATHADIAELKTALFPRWDKLEDKIDNIYTLVCGTVSREAFETAKDQLHARINDMEIRKQDKKGETL